jgi:hypothetical protein
MDRRLGAGALVALVFATLVGCGTAAPSPVVSAKPTSTPVAQETPPPSGSPSVEAGGGNHTVEGEPPLATYVAADTTSLRIGPVDDGGQATDYDYYEDSPEDVVAALTQAFGASPFVDDSSAAGTTYDWSGFQVVDLAGPGGFPDPPDFYLRVFTPEVSGVPIFLGEMGQVGRPLSAITEDIVEEVGACAPAPCTLTIAFAVPVDPEDAGLVPGTNPYNGTLVYSSGPEGPITSFLTPERRW